MTTEIDGPVEHIPPHEPTPLEAAVSAAIRERMDTAPNPRNLSKMVYGPDPVIAPPEKVEQFMAIREKAHAMLQLARDLDTLIADY